MQEPEKNSQSAGIMKKVEIFTSKIAAPIVLIYKTWKIRTDTAMMQKQEKHKVDSDLLFRFFNNDVTQEEEMAICKWLEESDEHKEIYGNARELHEAFLLQAPMELVNGDMPEAARKKRNARRIMWMAVANVAAVVLFCVIGFYAINERLENRLADTMTTISVPAGKSMDYTFADGTVIRLNSGARLTYPMAFAKDRREVRLDGEAYFDVTHNEKQPFIVKTFASDIEVLGTEFNVNADSEAGEFSATLIEGSIRLSSSILPGEKVIMHPNEKVTLVKDHLVFTEHDPESDIIWTKGFIDISGLDFARLMKKFEKAFGVEIVVSRKIESGPVFDNGKLRISDGIDNALGTIRKGGVEFVYSKDNRSNTIYIR